MKRSIFSFAALIVAILTFAFTKPQKSIGSDNSLTSYYWFEFQNGNLVPLSNAAGTHESDPFECDDAGSLVCTRAYLPGDTELYMDGAVQKRRPKSTGVIQLEIKKILE